MQYDEKTGKIADGQTRNASKYIKYLSKYEGKTEEALKFIKNNIGVLKNDILIINQWFNICSYGIKDKNRRTKEIFEIIKVVSSQVDFDDDTKQYKLNGLYNNKYTSNNKKLIDRLLNELKYIKAKATGKDSIELGKMYSKLYALKKHIYKIIEENKLNRLNNVER